MASDELPIASQYDGGITNYYFPGIKPAGNSDLSVSRGRVVYETVACEQCLKAGLPCWRPAPGRGRRFKKCLLCEKLQLKHCDELDVGRQSLVIPPTPYEGSWSLGSRKQTTSVHVNGIPPPPWAQSSPPKRSPSPTSASAPSSKRLRMTDIDYADPTGKLVLTPHDTNDHLVQCVIPVGNADMDPIRGRSLYETKPCESCVEAEKKHCWRAIDPSGYFTKCTRCFRKCIEGCQEIPASVNNLIVPGSKFKKKPIMPSDSISSISHKPSNEIETTERDQSKPDDETASSSPLPLPPTIPPPIVVPAPTPTTSEPPSASNIEALDALISAAQNLSTGTLLAGLRPVMQAKSEEAAKRYHFQLEALNNQLKEKEEAEEKARKELLDAIADKKGVQAALTAKKEEFESEMKQYRLFLATV